jgi:phosphoribosyl 1,2-cyclic phosphate phosphodiesterase
MRLRFLGTGTSSGVPAIACDCAVCTSDDPRDRRLRTSGLLSFTDPSGIDRRVLIDAGPDLREQALAARLTRLDAILFTHNHVDHTWGLDEVRRFNAVMGSAIDIYADAHTLDHLRRVYRHIFERENNIQRSFVATVRGHEVRPGEPFDLFGLRVTPVPLLHGVQEILGFRFDPAPAPSPGPSNRLPDPRAGSDLLPLAWCTDCSALPPAGSALLAGVRTLVLDALRHRPHDTHLTLAQAVSLARSLRPERTLFVHMSHDLPHETTNSDLPDGMRLAHDGLELGSISGSD